MIRGNRYTKGSARISRRGESKRILGRILAIGLPTAFLVGLVLLLRADFLQAKNFEILGVETLPKESLQNSASSFISGNKFFIIPKSNIFFINKDKLANALLAQFNRLEKVEVNKSFFSHKVELQITERKSEFLWCSAGDECFLMTAEGLVFASIDDLPDEALAKLGASSTIVFRGRLGGGDPLMKNFATSAEIQNFLKLVFELKTARFEVGSINIESSDRAVAKTRINDYVSDVIFNPSETDLPLVAQNVVLLINETLNKNPKATFQYIDARFGNKIFYKLI